MANAKVEVAVQLAQRWIYARLRNRRFTSLTELNAAIRALLEQFNNRRTRHLGASRRELFDQLERHALQPLPLEPYVFAEWRCRKVGVGKTWLACALGQKACRDNATVIYKRLPRLFSELQLAHDDGRFARIFRQLVKADLLILDDWGPERMTAPQRRDLMEIVEDRYGAGATLVTSQLPVEAWHDIVDEPTFADAILDRLIHNAHRLNPDGPSMRKTRDAPAAKNVDEQNYT